MRQYTKYIIIIILIVISHITAYAQDSLSYYLELAAKNNPGVKAKYLEYSAALEKLPQVSSLPDPSVQFGYFIKPMDLMGGNQVADVRIMQMFPWFGVLKAAKDEASKMAISKFESFRDVKNELYFNVKASYYTVYRTEKEISIANENLNILQSLEQIALVRLSTTSSASPSGNTGPVSTTASKPGMASAGGGMGSSMGGNDKNEMVNLLRIKIEIHELENRIALLNDQLITDKVSFNRFLDRSPKSEVFTADSLMEVTIPSDIITLGDSLINHPMVKMYEAEADADAAKVSMVKRMGYPTIGLGLDYMVIQKREGNISAMNGKDMTMPMVSLTLPVFRKKYKSMRHEAELLRDAASMSASNVKNDLTVNFQETLQKLNDASRRILLYKDQAMLADKSLQLLITSFSVSGADFEEVLRMEQQLLDYQFKKVEAVVDKNTSIARLIYLTGN
jgi:outer membrane protein TolC